MASRDSRSPSPTSTPSSRRMKTCARRCERVCCTIATYFPLTFVYGLTSWAVWVDASIGFTKLNPEDELTYSKKIPSAVGVFLYLLLNACYTTAVFVSPGSPTNSSPSAKRGKYSVLPTSEPTHDMSDVQTITVSSSGGARYCKKCHVSKPDRTHHCSTCKRCVLKMDHHCPWLATCLGLHNYKAFLLFLVYVSLFCWACFFNTGIWVYREIFESHQYIKDFAPVNVIILAILSGIIGLVISGFTGWHIYLSVRGQTTIECLEKTRYLRGVRRQVEQNRQEHLNHSRRSSEGLTGNLKRIGDQVLEFHANAVPGASRFEEGEEHTSPTPSVRLPHRTNFGSPAQNSLRSNINGNHSYADLETQRETDRYEEYLSDQESSKLPNAFDLGWRKNLLHLLGPNPFLWWLPVCNTTGDGWRWEVSEKWAQANDELNKHREERLRNAQSQNRFNNNTNNTNYQTHRRPVGPPRGEGGAGRYYDDGLHHDQPEINGSAVSMHTLKSHYTGRTMRWDFDTGSDGEVASFQVSGSEDEGEEEESDSDDDIGQMSSQSRSQRNDGDGWGNQW